MSAPIFDHLASVRARLARLLTGLCEHETHLHTQRILSAAIYGWVLLGTLLLLPYYDALWGPSSLANRTAFDPSRWTHWLVYLSLHPSLADHTWIFIAGQLFCLGLVLGGVASRLASIGVYLFTYNLYHRTGQLLDGGNNLAELLLFYFVLMNVSGRPIDTARPLLRKLAIAGSNAALYMCRIQVVVVYLCAGVLKLNGPLWQKGMALYYILQGESYTHPVVQEFVVAHPAAAMIGTYATMAFQILFVVLIWRRAARPYLIAAGVGLHLFGIGLSMGLLLFGLIMCLGYLAFLPADVSARLRAPWISATPLRVVVPPSRPRLRAVMVALARVDLRDRVEVHLATTGDGLRAYDPSTERESVGVAALWAIARRFPLWLPVLPLALAAWYLGLAQRMYRALDRGLDGGPTTA